MRKHRLGKQLLIVLCVVLIVFLAGCRPSPVLEQIVYEQNHQVDPDTETKTMNDDLENEEPDEDIPSRETVDDSEQTKDQDYTSALAGDTDTDSDPDAVYSVSYSPYGDLSEPAETDPTADSTSETATGTNEAGGNEGGNFASGEGSEPGNDGTSDGDSGGGTDAGTGQTGGGNGDGDNGLVSGEGTQSSSEPVQTPTIDDNNGGSVDLPTGTRVTAVGEAAVIVEMMGDSAQLVGTSSSFQENSLAQQAFASQEASAVPIWWEGDGSSECSNFQALLDAQPEVCFVIDGQGTFSEAQYAALAEAGIEYVLLPQLNSIENIKTAVTRVGDVLGDDAKSIASNYCSWADNTISWASGNYSTKATTYIGRWDPDARWTIQSLQGRGTLASGEGVPVSIAYSGISPLNECMGYAGLINTAMDNYYVEPLYRLEWEPTITGETARYPSNRTIYTVYSEELGVGLGTEAFPAVIVENSSIRDKILQGDYYRYHWQAGEMIRYNTSYVYGIPLYDADNTFLSTWIQNEKRYQILVNPSGVGNWAKGSVESPLEAAWLACEFQGRDMGELQSKVSDFYRTFYGTEANISAIMPDDWTYGQ